MNKDRGMIKWMPFNSVVASKDILYSLMKEKTKVTRPIMSDDEIKTIEDAIIDAYYTEQKVYITYFKNGYNYEYYGKIKKIDSSNKGSSKSGGE